MDEIEEKEEKLYADHGNELWDSKEKEDDEDYYDADLDEW